MCLKSIVSEQTNQQNGTSILEFIKHDVRWHFYNSLPFAKFLILLLNVMVPRNLRIHSPILQSSMMRRWNGIHWVIIMVRAEDTVNKELHPEFMKRFRSKDLKTRAGRHTHMHSWAYYPSNLNPGMSWPVGRQVMNHFVQMAIYDLLKRAETTLSCGPLFPFPFLWL